MKWVTAAAVLALLAAFFLLRTKERTSVEPDAVLPMPDSASRLPTPPRHALSPGFRADDAAPAVAAAPREAEAPAAASSVRARAASVTAAEDEVSLLDDVLGAHNDNDPRLDSAFNGLSFETRRRFQEKYRKLPPESRNQRGTIVYLLGKNLRAPEDWAFLREVVGEKPCLSLADCATASMDGNDGDPGAAVTLAYPAMVALKQAERVLAGKGSGSVRREALSVVRAGKDSPVPRVVEAAARLEGLF